MKKRVKTICVLLILATLITLNGCAQSKHQIEGAGSSTSSANVMMGMGAFAYRNGFIYFSTSSSICEYEIETGKTVTLSIGSDTFPTSLHVTDDHILFVPFGGSALARLTRDGKQRDTLFEHQPTCIFTYIDGTDAYILEANGATLIHRDLHTGKETKLLDRVNCFDVDDTYIYATVTKEKPYSLFRAPKNTLQFEQIDLSFDPIKVFSYGEDLFLCSSYDETEEETGMRYQIIRYSGGKEYPLPINGEFYQVLDDCVIYLDEYTFANSSFSLKCYNLKTGEKTVLHESVQFFGILEQRYICFWGWDDAQSWWVYDWQTKQVTQMA